MFSVIEKDSGRWIGRIGPWQPEGWPGTEVGWSLVTNRAESRLKLCWRECGGPPVSPPERKGFGSRLLERGLAHELDGAVRLDYAPAGLVCEIEIPVGEAF